MTIDIADDSNKDFKKKIPRNGWHGYNNSNYYKCFQNYYHGHNYLNPNPQYITDIKASVNHWQLRDLIQVDQESGKLYHTKDDSLRVVNLRDRSGIKSDEHMKLEYFPKCFNHTQDGLVVTGGLLTSASKAYSVDLESLSLAGKAGKSFRSPKGLFSFYNPGTGISKTVKLGDVINNSVTIYPHSNSQYKSYVCNNDSNLYIVDINNEDRLTLDNKINCELNTSLNNVCKSPTSDKVLTVTGDSSSIFLLDPSSNSKISKIETNHDSGFGISYHPNGNIFATAFQDGTCSIYDIRNLSNPLTEITSTRPGHQAGAFRCCKFANSSINDLLVILEHVGRVHLFDLRNMNNQDTNDHQVIVFPFALDQFGDYKKQKSEAEEKLSKSEKQEQDDEDSESTTHGKFGIYGDSASMFRSTEFGTVPRQLNLQFTAPLVYDYDYLTNVNPKLFKNYTYQTPPSTNNSDNTYLPPPEFNYPQWNDSNNDCNNTSNARGSISIPPQQPDPDYHFGEGPNDTMEYMTSLGSTESRDTSHSNSSYDYFYQESYQKSVNHIHGEMELAGIDWFDRQLLIGCEDGGILSWDINVLGRRSFGSFSYV